MNLKKFFSAMMLCIFAVTLFTGCGEDKKVEAPAVAEAQIGMLRHMNASEKDFNNFVKNVSEIFSLKMTSYNPVFFDNLNSMQMALETGKISAFTTYRCVADYLIARNPKFEIADDNTLEFIDAFCFALREGDRTLIDTSNKAIREMRDDGTLDKLVEEYIKKNKKEDEITAIEIPKISGAETIKVAVTGDLPPLDYINADGTAAGFNTAVLAELSRRLGKNIELVQIESGSRAAALTSGRVDIVFWAIVPVSEIIPANADKPAGIELTSPYYRGKVVHVRLKK